MPELPYTLLELMAVAAAREIQDGVGIFAGACLPMSIGDPRVMRGQVPGTLSRRPEPFERHPEPVEGLSKGQSLSASSIIAAHSSPVMVMVEGSPLLAAADALTILDQIEGALVYLDTVGTRAEDRLYKRMRLVLESAHRTLHHRMHLQGNYHVHLGAADQ